MITFALELATETTSEVVEIDFDKVAQPTPEATRQIARIYEDHEPKSETAFTAVCVFASLDRPDEEWPIIGPVLEEMLS